MRSSGENYQVTAVIDYSKTLFLNGKEKLRALFFFLDFSNLFFFLSWSRASGGMSNNVASI